jgi:hypothetical protein
MSNRFATDESALPDTDECRKLLSIADEEVAKTGGECTSVFALLTKSGMTGEQRSPYRFLFASYGELLVASDGLSNTPQRINRCVAQESDLHRRRTNSLSWFDIHPASCRTTLPILVRPMSTMDFNALVQSLCSAQSGRAFRCRHRQHHWPIEVAVRCQSARAHVAFVCALSALHERIGSLPSRIMRLA